MNTAELDTNFDDLEALVAESTRTVKAKDVKGLEDLDALLTESLAIKQEENAGKAYREILRRGGLTKDEAREIEAKLQEWESRREWETQANIAVFRHTICRCGGTQTTFVGMYYRQKHRTMRETTRTVAAKASLEQGVTTGRVSCKVLNETQYETRNVPMCAACAHDHGFILGTATEAVWNKD